MMKSLTIEELLCWAFVHELPKGGGVDGLDNANSAWRMLQASSWGKVTDWAELMTLVDTGRPDAENFMIDQGDPHDDALAVGEAVADLGRCGIVVPDGWSPLADWPEIDDRLPPLRDLAVANAVERWNLRPPRRRAVHLVSLVVGSAVLGKAPGWEAPVPKIRMVERGGRPAWFLARRVCDRFGRESTIEVDGYNARAQRPHRGAYRKFELSEDPTADIMGRLDRELWAAALLRLEGMLANRLAAHRLLKWDCEIAPWGAAGPRIALLARQGAAEKLRA